MATHTTVITVVHRDDQLPNAARMKDDPQLFMTLTGGFFESLAGGALSADVSAYRDGGDAVAASGTVTFATASGSTTTTINGVGIIQTTGTDAERAAALVASITDHANPLVQLVSATANAGVVTLVAKASGAQGNTYTLAVTGTGITASGNRLAGGTNATANEVRI